MNPGPTSPRPHSEGQQPAWWRAPCLAAIFLVGGCVTNGDFDRVRPLLVSDDIHDWIGRDERGNVRAQEFAAPMTDDERLLRDLAYPLIEPPFDRNRWYSVIGEYGGGPARGFAFAHARVNPAAYWEDLQARSRRSESSRYAQITTDVRNDALRIEPFFAVALRVFDMDLRRAQSLVHVASLTLVERDNALIRNRETLALVKWVCRSLQGRVVAYRYALEHQVVAAPSAMAAEADRAVTFLQQQIAGHCRIAPAPTLVSKG